MSTKLGWTIGLGLALVLGAVGAQADVYTLDNCPVSGMKLGSMGDPVVKEYDGNEVRFCCGGCPAKFEADPAQYTAKIDTAIVEQQLPVYPLDTCLVSGEKLGSMGDPVNLVHNNRLVRLCCNGCAGKFEASADELLSKLDAAVVEAQKADYPLDVCAVSGEKLGSMGDPVELVSGNRLVRLCCSGCVKQFEKAPAKFLAKVSEADSAESRDSHANHNH